MNETVFHNSTVQVKQRNVTGNINVNANYSLTKKGSDIRSEERVISIAEPKARVVLKRVNTRKAVGTAALLC